MHDLDGKCVLGYDEVKMALMAKDLVVDRGWYRHQEYITGSANEFSDAWQIKVA